MKSYIFLIIFFLLSITSYSQSEQGTRVFSGKCAIAQSGSGAGYWQVDITNFNDPGGNEDATGIQAGDYLYFTDNGETFALEIQTIVSAGLTTATIRVKNSTITDIVAVPTTNNAFISSRTVNYGLIPWISNITDNENQLTQEYNWYKLDSILAAIYSSPDTLYLSDGTVLATGDTLPDYSTNKQFVTTDSFVTFVPNETPIVGDLVWSTTRGALFQKTSSTTWTRRSYEDGQKASTIYNVTNDTLTFNANLNNRAQLSLPTSGTDAYVAAPTNIATQAVGEVFQIGIQNSNDSTVTVTWNSVFGKWDGTAVGSTTITAGSTVNYLFQTVTDGLEGVILRSLNDLGGKPDTSYIRNDSVFVVFSSTEYFTGISESGILTNYPGSTTKFASDTSVAPDTTGAPSTNEIEVWNYTTQDTNWLNSVIFYTGTDDSTDVITYVYFIDSDGNATLLESPTDPVNFTRRLIPSPAFANSNAPLDSEALTFINNLSPPAKPLTIFIQADGAVPGAGTSDNPETAWLYDGVNVTRVKDFPRKFEVPGSAFADSTDATGTEVLTWLLSNPQAGNYLLAYHVGSGTVDKPDFAWFIAGDTDLTSADIVTIKEPGGVPDGDKTDIDVSGNVWTIDTSAVTTVKIADDAVTLAKQAAGTANRLIGYDGSGNPSEIAAGTNVTISGGTISTTSVVVADTLDALPAATAFKSADRVVLTDSTVTFQKLIDQARDSLNTDSIFTDANVSSSTITAITKNRKDVSIYLALTDSVTFDRSVSLPATNTNAKRFTFYANYDTTGLVDYSYYLSGKMFFRGQRITKYYLDKGEMVIAEFRDSLYFLETDFEPNFAGRQAIKEGRTVPGITIVDEKGHKWETATFPEFGFSKVADGIVQFYSNKKVFGGQNIFTRLDRVGTNVTPWQWVGTAMTYTANDTIHPVTGKYEAARYTLNATTGTQWFNNSTLNGYYYPDSTYTITFWARKGKNAASSNVTLTVKLEYSGNPDVSKVVNLTTEWQRFNIQMTALGSSRVFAAVAFVFAGDAGDYAYITDFNLRKGAYYYPFYAETRDSVFTGDRIYVNAKVENSTLNFEQFRGARANNRKTLQYVMDQCATITGCNKVLVQDDITIDSTIALKEGVILEGGFTGTALTGSGNYTLQGTKITTTLADSTKVAIQATGTSQIAGVGIKNFQIATTRKIKAAIATGDALNIEIENITINTNDGNVDSLKYGILFEAGSLKAQLNNVVVRSRDYGFYGTSSLAELKNCRSLNSKWSLFATGGTWNLDKFWAEDNYNGGIYFSSLAGRLTVNDIYLENSPVSGTNPPIYVSAAENLLMTGGVVSTYATPNGNLRTVFIDSVGTASFIGMSFVNQGDHIFKNTVNSGTLTAIGNNHSSTTSELLPIDWTDIVDSSRVVSLNNVKRSTTSTVTYDRNWIGKPVATGYNFYDGYLIEQDKKIELNGDQNIRGDTINLIGTQNLLNHSEGLNIFSSGKGWNDLGTLSITADDTLNAAGQLKADLIVYVSGLRLLNAANIGPSIKPNTPYTVQYQARKTFGSVGVNYVQAQFNVAGSDDVFFPPDTITTSWQTFTHTVVSPSISTTFDLFIGGDSVWITKVLLTEGYVANPVYTETTTSAVTSKEVVFNGDLQLNGALVDSSGSPGTAGQVPISTVTGWHWGPVIQSSDFTATVTQSGSDTLQNGALCYGYFERNGNYVDLNVRIEVAFLAAGAANTFYFDPPIASNFTTEKTDVIGRGGLDTQALSSSNIPQQRCLAFASTSDDKIGISVDPPDSLTYPDNRMYITVQLRYVIQ